MWNKIVNPLTGRKVNINSKLGQTIIHNYLNVLVGGSSKEASEKAGDKLNVLSYNVSWEALTPKPDWNIGPNPYTQGDGENGLGFLCNKDVEVCRQNIFEVLANGLTNTNGEKEPYDLMGLQEYYPEALDEKIKGTLSDMTMVSDYVELPLPNFIKPIFIASLFNHKKFKLHHTILGEFLARQRDGTLGHDGRPFLILLLENIQSNEMIIFINAHMPQTRNIINEEGDEPQIVIQKVLESAITSNIPEEIYLKARIIMCSDTNDCGPWFAKDDPRNNEKYAFIDKFTILDKKLYLGSDLRKTCCSSTLIPIDGKKYVKPPSHRFGDVVLDSKSGEFVYNYPKFTEPASDHLPIACQLIK